MKGREIIEKINRGEMPDLEQVRVKCLGQTTSLKGAGKLKFASVAIGVAAAFLVTMTALAAALGGFEGFINRVNPTFGEAVIPIELYVVDNDIRMEVLGAQTFGNQVIAYISMQDLSGQNRITENARLNADFTLLDADGNEIATQGSSGGSSLLYFDKSTNTAFFEANFWGYGIDVAFSESADSIIIRVGTFELDNVSYWEMPIDIDLVALGEVSTKMFPVSDLFVWGITTAELAEMGFERDVLRPVEILKPGGLVVELPHGRDDQWISNIGIVNGQLQILLAHDNRVRGLSWPSAFLVLDGVPPKHFVISIFADENHEFIETLERVDLAFKYSLYVFDIDVNQLADYEILFFGGFRKEIDGDWQIAAQTNYVGEQMRVWESDFYMAYLYFENFILTPLGLQASGTFEGGGHANFDLVLETTEGFIEFDFPRPSGQFSSYPQPRFDLVWRADRLIDVASVTAVVINGVRIEVE